MDSNRRSVTVKRIEKIPSKYYVEIPKVHAKVQTGVKVELAPTLRADHKRLTDALTFRPPLSTDYTKTVVAWFKKQAAAVKTGAAGLLSGVGGFLIENAKRLAFSAAVSGTVAAAACVVLLSTCSLGCVIEVNGQVIGVARNKSTYHELVSEINREIDYVSDADFVPAGKPTFSAKLIAKGAFSSNEDMKEKLKSTSDDMLPAYGVYVEDEIIFALANEQSALSVLNEYKDSFTQGMADVTAEFLQPVKVSRRFVPKKALTTKERAAESLAAGRIAVHQLAEGEALADVAASYGITVDDILKNNIIYDPEHPVAGALNIPTGQPLLSVKTIAFQTIEETIPYQTVENEDPTKYEGTVVVEQEGAEGSRVIEAYVTSVNGVETERNVVSENLLSTAVDRIVCKGTKEPPSPIGTGSLAVPANGTLSSRFGSRWGRSHQGVDIAASVGTDIYAADNGTVIYSDYNDGGYGYLIQLDHGNGIVTYYGHCSELLVPEGTVVAKGDLIARVGNTGRSTGPHLHFEVRINGSPTDPMAYLNGIGE